MPIGSKVTKSKVEISAWLQEETEDKLMYMFQIQATTSGLAKEVGSLLKGKESGVGYDSEAKQSIVLIRRGFLSRKKFREFSSEFRFEIQEV